jgi:hypothetical protein
MNYRNGYNMSSLQGLESYELDVECVTLEGGVEAQREVMRDAGVALREILEG